MLRWNYGMFVLTACKVSFVEHLIVDVDEVDEGGGQQQR